MQTYTTPELEIVRFENEDVITTSTTGVNIKPSGDELTPIGG